MSAGARGRRTSRIALRLFTFNLLILFLPIAGVLYLDVYEARLLETQERAMVQQARLLAAAVGGQTALDPQAIEGIIARLERRTDARLRVYDANGNLVADSARDAAQTAPETSTQYDQPSPGIRDRVLYRLGVWGHRVRSRIVDVWRAAVVPTHEVPRPDPAGGLEPEVRAALEGRYGATLRRTPGQRSLTMHSAVPIRNGGTVTGAVVVSQTTYRILQALYEVRLRIFEIVVASTLAAAALTAIAAMTIVRPLRRLRRRALALAERGPSESQHFPETARRDELGDLARALEELTRRLNDHIRLLESFAADVSHEFRNPLASIRTAAELMSQADSTTHRERFFGLLLRDVDRLERLVAGVRELARIDGQLEHEQTATLDLVALIGHVVEGQRLASPGKRIELAADSPTFVRGSAERLTQVFENLLSNAMSFTASGGTVEVALSANETTCTVSIADTGPGIPQAHLSRVFDRFFTYRPSEDRRQHLGLGLAIAKTIVEGYGGSIAASNRSGGGAVFAVDLAIAPAPSRERAAAAARS